MKRNKENSGKKGVLGGHICCSRYSHNEFFIDPLVSFLFPSSPLRPQGRRCDWISDWMGPIKTHFLWTEFCTGYDRRDNVLMQSCSQMMKSSKRWRMVPSKASIRPPGFRVQFPEDAEASRCRTVLGVKKLFSWNESPNWWPHDVWHLHRNVGMTRWRCSELLFENLIGLDPDRNTEPTRTEKWCTLGRILLAVKYRPQRGGIMWQRPPPRKRRKTTITI